MLRITRRSEYGVIAITHLAQHPGGAVSAREIAERYGIPKRLLAEVMKDLAHRGLVRSTRGVSGGYSLAIDPEKTSLRRVLEALDGPFEIVQCTSASSAELCELLATCPIKGAVQRIHEKIHGLLEGVSLADIIHPPLAGALAPAAALSGASAPAAALSGASAPAAAHPVSLS